MKNPETRKHRKRKSREEESALRVKEQRFLWNFSVF